MLSTYTIPTNHASLTSPNFIVCASTNFYIFCTFFFPTIRSSQPRRLRRGFSVFKIVLILSFKGMRSLMLFTGVTSTLGMMLSSMPCRILSGSESSSPSRKGYGFEEGSSGLKRSSKEVRKRERRCGLGGSRFLILTDEQRNIGN